MTEDKPASLSEFALRQCLTNRILQLIVMPTEQCNFRCAYCFESYEHGRMDEATVRGIKRFIDRRAEELVWLAIDWYGGEPLLAADIVEEIQRHARSVEARHPALRLRSSMTTNGYLLDSQRLMRLLDVGVTNYMIAIDGPPRIHDRRRVTANGRGTFDRIWANLRAARAQTRDFAIKIRVQLDRRSGKALDEFLELYRSEFASDSRFELSFYPLRCASERGANVVDFLDDEESERVPVEAQERAAKLNLPYSVPPASKPCHAAHGNSFVVRPDGSLSKCAVALSDPCNRVGRLEEDGQVEIDDAKINPWLRGLWSGDSGELGCPLVGLTATGD